MYIQNNQNKLKNKFKNLDLLTAKKYHKLPIRTTIVTTLTLSAPTDKQATSILHQRQKVRQDNLAALYGHLNVTFRLDLIHLKQFGLTRDPEKSNPDLLFFDDRH